MDKSKYTGTANAGEDIHTPEPLTVRRLMEELAKANPDAVVMPDTTGIGGYLYPFTVVRHTTVAREDTKDFGPRYRESRPRGIPAVMID